MVMQHKTVMWLLVGVVALVIIVLSVRRESVVPVESIPPTATTTSATSTGSAVGGATTAVDLGGGIVAQVPAGVKIAEVPVDTTQEPDLNYQVHYSGDIPPEVVTILTTNIASTTAALKKDPSRGDLWLRLAYYYKTTGDYHAAESVWIYMTKVAPSNFVAFSDLGDLYQNFLKEYPQAEANYLQAVKLKPDDIDLYRNLYMMYKYQYKTNTIAAADILAQGLKANPNNPDLLALQKQ